MRKSLLLRKNVYKTLVINYLRHFRWLNFWQKQCFCQKLPNVQEMAKKMSAQNARLVKGKRWYVDYELMAENGELSRHRHDFDLNDIADETIREKVGTTLAGHLARFVERLQKTIPSETETETVAGIFLCDAIQDAINSKLSDGKTERTKSDYKYCGAQFLAWLKKNGYGTIPALDFGKKHARAYWSHLGNKKDKRSGKALRGKTLNNQLTLLRALWSEMMDLEHCQTNPFKVIKPALEEEKSRRKFTVEESRIVAQEAQKTNYWLFRGILLQYYCYVRPVELTRLRFRDFDLAAGTVSVQVNKGKPHRRLATIPTSVMHYFRDGKFDQFPVNYHVFGIVEKGDHQFEMSPSTKPCGDDRPYQHHQKLLKRLKKEGKLKDISGLTWYSWKDTGISVHAHSTTPMATKDQAGHTDFDMTLKYYHAPKINDQYKGLPDTLIV